MHNSRFISVSPDFCVLVALSLLMLPTQWVIGWILAALVHELFHIFMLQILKVKMISIRLCGFGATILSDSMLPHQECLCALAGPIGGLTAVMLLRINPYIALSAIVQSIYNLLPVYPLDGGRALKSAALCFLGESVAQKIVTVTSVFIISALIFIGIILSCRYRLGLIPVIFPALPVALTAVKNSLQREKNNSTMFLHASE